MPSASPCSVRCFVPRCHGVNLPESSGYGVHGVSNNKTEKIYCTDGKAEHEENTGQQSRDFDVDFVVSDSADSSHAAGLTKVRVKHLRRDMIWNTETTL